MENRKRNSNQGKKWTNYSILHLNEKRIKSKPTIYIDTETGLCLNTKEKNKLKERGMQYVIESQRFEKTEKNPYTIQIQKIVYGKIVKNKWQQLTLF